MKRLFVVAVALSALLLPTLTFAQGVKSVYRPEVHGTIIVVPEASVTPETKVANVAKAEVEKFREFADQIKPEDFEHER